MSCYLCADDMFNLIGTLYASNDHLTHRFDNKTPAQIAGLLYRKNIEAYDARHEPEEPDDADDYKYCERDLSQLEPVQILKALQCVAYQCNSDDGWYSTLEFQIITALKETQFSKLIGYDEALWGCPDLGPRVRNLSDMKKGEKPAPGEIVRLFS